MQASVVLETEEKLVLEIGPLPLPLPLSLPSFPLSLHPPGLIYYLPQNTATCFISSPTYADVRAVFVILAALLAPPLCRDRVLVGKDAVPPRAAHRLY